jgi:non-ribosomal peptide synthetase component F
MERERLNMAQDNLYGFLTASLAKDPDKIAVRDNGKTLSYRQLQQRVHKLISIFQQHGIQAGQFIGVHLKPSEELVAILLAVTKLGAVFVPLETSYPKKRLLFMIQDAGLSLLITDKPDADFDAHVTCPQLLLSDLQVNQAIAANLEMPAPEPDDVCYIIYTSGTTGDPKGVLVNYAGSMNTVVQSVLTMDVQPQHQLLQLSPISFDVFVLEVGMVMFAGATLVITDDVGQIPLDQVLSRHNIQHMLCTPNFADGVDLRTTPLHTVMFGGEPMPKSIVEQYLGCFNMVHAYGITEAAICSTLGRCDGIYPVSIGTPIANTSLELLDESLNPVPAGGSRRNCSQWQGYFQRLS